MEKEILNAEITREDNVVEQANQPKDYTAMKAALLGGLGVLAGASAEAAVLYHLKEDEEPIPASPQPQPQPQSTANSTTTMAHTHQTVTHVHKHEYDINVVNNGGPTPEPTPGPDPNGDPEITVLRYYTIFDEDTGDPLYDVAEIQVKYPNGTAINGLVVDADRDGIADKMVLDANANSSIDQDEIIDLHEQNLNIPMKNLYDVALEKDFENDVVTAEPVSDDIAMIDDEDVLDDSDNIEVEEYAEAVTDENTNDTTDEYLPENDPCVGDNYIADTNYVDDMDNGILDA